MDVSKRKGCAGIVFFIIWLIMTLRWIWGILVGVFKLAVVLVILAVVVLLILVAFLAYRKMSSKKEDAASADQR